MKLQTAPWRFVGAAAAWHVTSQQQARRNALVASTALTARRTEQIEVEEYLARHVAARGGRPVAATFRSA
jgi:hypothetical protein